jgi:effector-binding domain-containing protein
VEVVYQAILRRCVLKIWVTLFIALFMVAGCNDAKQNAKPDAKVEVSGESAVARAGAPKDDSGQLELAKQDKAEAAPPAKLEPPAEATPEEKVASLLAKVFDAYGGAKTLQKNLGKHTLITTGIYGGKAVELVTTWVEPDKLVVHSVLDDSTVATVEDKCWLITHGVVVECPSVMLPGAGIFLWVSHLFKLYPLTEEGLTLTYMGDLEIEGVKAEGLEVKKLGVTPSVRLVFEKDKGLLRRVSYYSPFGALAGDTVIDFVDYASPQGELVPLPVKMTIGGDELSVSEVKEFKAGEIDYRQLMKPKQARFGLNQQRQQIGYVAATAVHKGGYIYIGQTIGKLFQWIIKSHLIPNGPTVLVYVKGPQQAEDSKDYLTEIRIPVIYLGELPATTEEFSIQNIPGDLLAYRIERGSYDKVSEGYTSLVNWAAKSGLQISGPAGMITYNSPVDTAEQHLVSELFFPVEEVGK